MALAPSVWAIGLGTAITTWVVVSCTTEEASAPLDAGTLVVASRDSAPEAEVLEAGGTCPGATPTSYPWKSPVTAEASACSELDLAKLKSAIAEKKLTSESDIGAALGPACAACAIGRLDDPKWRAIVGGHQGYIGNVGGCVVRLGASETCGQSVDALSTCLIVGCKSCTNRKEQDTCADALTTVDGACAKSLSTMRASCSASIVSAAFSATGTCQSFVDTIRLFCGPSPDLGDASTD